MEAIRIIEEKRRRDKDRRPVFADRASPTQMAILRCRDLERFVFSGNGFGKTAVGAEDLRAHLTGKNPHTGEIVPVPIKAYIILDSPEKIERIILPELRKWMNILPEECHKRGKPYIAEISRPNGSLVTFLFHDADPMKCEGIEGDYFWFDEPPPRKLYVALRRGGRTKGSKPRYLVTATPLAAPWMRTEVKEQVDKGLRPGCSIFRGDTEDNVGNLKEGYIEEFSAALTDKEKAIRLHGEFFDLEGLALSHLFRRETHTIPRDKLDWNERNPCVLVIDPHPSKAHHMVILGADRDNQLFVLEEFKQKTVARNFIKAVIKKGWLEKYRVLDIVYDSLGSAEMTSGEGFLPFGTVINEELKKIGKRARATTFEEKLDEDFIERIRDALLLPDEPDNFGQYAPQLRFVDDCVGSISDVENVQWAKDKSSDENKPKLEISNRDFLSCLKYALACNIYFSKPKERAYYTNKNPYGIPVAEGRKAKARTLSRQFKVKAKPNDDDEGWEDF